MRFATVPDLVSRGYSYGRIACFSGRRSSSSSSNCRKKNVTGYCTVYNDRVRRREGSAKQEMKMDVQLVCEPALGRSRDGCTLPL